MIKKQYEPGLVVEWTNKEYNQIKSSQKDLMEERKEFDEIVALWYIDVPYKEIVNRLNVKMHHVKNIIHKHQRELGYHN